MVWLWFLPDPLKNEQWIFFPPHRYTELTESLFAKSTCHPPTRDEHSKYKAVCPLHRREHFWEGAVNNFEVRCFVDPPPSWEVLTITTFLHGQTEQCPAEPRAPSHDFARSVNRNTPPFFYGRSLLLLLLFFQYSRGFQTRLQQREEKGVTFFMSDNYITLLPLRVSFLERHLQAQAPPRIPWTRRRRRSDWKDSVDVFKWSRQAEKLSKIWSKETSFGPSNERWPQFIQEDENIVHGYVCSLSWLCLWSIFSPFNQLLITRFFQQQDFLITSRHHL